MSTPTIVKPDALDTFKREPTPLNAVLLAIADHRAQGPIQDREFIHQLHRAADALRDCAEADAELVDALEGALSWLSSYPGGGAIAAYNKARAAIARATAPEGSVSK